MPVGSSAWNEAEKVGERGQSLDVFRKMTRMSHFDTVEADLHERFEPLTSAFLARMSPDRERAGLMCE